MYSKQILKYFKNPKHAGSLKNPDGVGKVGNPTCLTSNEMIHINDSLVPISLLNNKNKTLTHNGYYNKISEVFKRNFKGELVNIKNKFGSISLTPEHLVYAIKLPKKRKYFDTAIKKTLIPAWYHAEDLENRDITLYPILKEVKNIKELEIGIKKKKYDFRSKKIPNKVKLNNSFLRLAGYYLSEGTAREEKCKTYLTFSLHIDELDIAEDIKRIVKKLFGLEVKFEKIPKRNALIVNIYNAFLSRFFRKLFGYGTLNKKIPHFMMLLPLNKQKSLIKGLWMGEGYTNIERKGIRAGYSTISYQLIHQLKTLLLRQKIVPSVYYEDEKIKNGLKHKKSYRIHLGDRDSLKKLCKILNMNFKSLNIKEKKNSWFDNNYFYTPISGISRLNYNGPVHNLEVAKVHSFTTSSLCVHNCGDIMKVYIKVKDNKITKVKVETLGCVAAIASSEVLAEIAEGKSLGNALKIKREDILERMGEMPKEKIHCSVLAQSALKKAIEDYKKRK